MNIYQVIQCYEDGGETVLHEDATYEEAERHLNIAEICLREQLTFSSLRIHKVNAEGLVESLEYQIENLKYRLANAKRIIGAAE